VAVHIIKSSGLPERFDINKLVDSLVRSGAPGDVALDIAEKIEKEITPSMRTKAIFRLARKHLKQYNRVSGMKYSLKKALHALGPSGYPFEKYFARVLAAHGYSVELDRIVEGYCVRHEVDVVAQRGNEHFMVECKYHNAGNTTDVKVALYVHARFEDVKKACETGEEKGSAVRHGWLVTNTRCTTDAIKYAECSGLKITSWRYPDRESLESMIEEKRLYPVTVLPSARRRPIEALFAKDIVLAQDVASLDEETLAERCGLDADTAGSLKRQADELCPCGG
jgi:Holliday junction resolvase